jgi:hypothetical protein
VGRVPRAAFTLMIRHQRRWISHDVPAAMTIIEHTGCSRVCHEGRDLTTRTIGNISEAAAS